MEVQFQEFVNNNGKTILYTGSPDLQLLEELSQSNGDLWHSSFEQGYKNAFSDVVYFTSVFFWYVSDFEGLDQAISWRLNPNMFAIRKEAWELLGGFDQDYENVHTQALDFAFSGLKNSGLVPYYVKGLYSNLEKEEIKISTTDRYIFYRKNFKKIDHSLYMLYMRGAWRWSELMAFKNAYSNYSPRLTFPILPIKKLKEIEGNPTVSYIIPTMNRQDFTITLLEDLKKQTYLPTQVIVVDATSEEKRDESLYNPENYPFEVIFKWQETKGSCRARNEGIDLCTGDYIIFGDDDIRLPNNFIKDYMSFMQTNQAEASIGLDIRADNLEQDLIDLERKANELGDFRWIPGVSKTFNNANTCVRKEHVNKLGGNDINYDGGYGEDADFGLSLTKIGVPVFCNPYSPNLHLKPPEGGYRVWGSQARVLGKKRKPQPWELGIPVKYIRPVPSPTKMYEFHKHFDERQLEVHRSKYLIMYLFKGSRWGVFFRFLNLPYRIMQFNKSEFYAKRLIELGVRIK